MTRPWVLAGHEPIVQLVGIYMALLYGIFYRMHSSLFSLLLH